MKSSLCIVMAAALSVGSVSFGAISNPEGFESYATGAFTAGASDGWDQGQVQSGVPTIVAAGSWDGSKALNVIEMDDSKNSVVEWQNGGSTGTLLYKVDFSLNSGDDANYARIQFYVGEGGNQSSGGYLTFTTYSSPQAFIGTTDTGANYSVLPGSTDFASANWYTAELEIDYTNNQVMGRFAPVGQALPAFTTVSPATPFVLQPTDTFWISTNGNASYDNLSLTVPEPASLGLLAVGGLLMLRRRRNESKV